jgi:hypothetical protein
LVFEKTVLRRTLGPKKEEVKEGWIICNSGFLDIVHHLYFNKMTAFRKLDFLLSSGTKGRTKTLAVGSPG